MDPFSLWLLGGVVIPDAYQRVIDAISKPSFEDRLSRRVRDEVGRYPKGVFRRWYRTQETWDALVRGKQDSFDLLVDRLVDASAERALGRKLSRKRAEAIVRSAVAGFIGSLEPSDSVAVADYRSSERARNIDENARKRTDELREHIDLRFEGIEILLDSAADFDDRIAALPAPIRPFFAAVGATRESLRLLAMAASEEPRGALVQLTADLPSWLRDASAAALVAAAELCRSYRVHVGASQLFEIAADRATDRGYYYARAAVELATAGDADRSNELVERATSLSSSAAVRAIAAALDNDPKTVLLILPPEEALRDPYLVCVHLYGLQATSSFGDVIPFLTAALERYPDSSGLMIELAWAYLQRSQSTATTSRTDDRGKALKLGLEARKLGRSWRIDAADAARVACQAALQLGAYDVAIRVGMEPPAGEAMPDEAANVEVRLSVAQAAVLSGNLGLLRSVVEYLPEGFHRALIQADVLAHSEADHAALVAAYDTVWTQTVEEEHRVLYWLSASGAGVDPHGTEELSRRTDDVPLLVEAQLHLASGRHDAAIALLRESRRTEHTTRLLVEALRDTGDIDKAVDELKAAATRFNDTLHLVRAVELLCGADRPDDAATLAEEALQRVPRTMTNARAFLHEVLIERAGTAGEWNEMTVRSRAWIEDLGSSLRNRWHLAFALYKAGDRSGSWRILQESPPLEPTIANEARLWIAVAAKEAPSPDVADRILELVGMFPEDSTLVDGAVGLFFGRGDGVWGEVHPETVTRYQELLATRAVDFGSDDHAAITVLTGSAEEMLEKLRPSLEARATAIEEISKKIRQGWPYGMLTSVGGASYTAALLKRAGGCLPIAVIDSVRAGRELHVAQTSLGNPVVVDTSTLVVGNHVRQVWPQLRGSFSRLELPSPAHEDILEAVEELQTPSHGTLYFDASSQAVRGRDADAVTQGQLLERGLWVADQVSEAVICDWPRLVALNERYDETFRPWMSALDMAKARKLPLWCDDVGLRTLAANDGVPTFGTTALIAALAASGRIDPGAERTALRRLRQEYAVDLPLDAEWLRLSAASEEWRPGPAAFHFTRPAAWRDFDEAYNLWSELAQMAATTEQVRVAGWVQAAMEGLSGAVAPDTATHLISAIAAKGIAMAGFDGDAIAACAARAREVTLAAGLANAVPKLMATLLHHLADAVGPAAAARQMMSVNLAAPDRSVVRDLVFGLSSEPSPFD